MIKWFRFDDEATGMTRINGLTGQGESEELTYRIQHKVGSYANLHIYREKEDDEGFSTREQVLLGRYKTIAAAKSAALVNEKK